MKGLVLAAVLWGCVGGLAADIPRSVFRIDDLDEAKSEAAAEEEPLVFVYSDENTTCPLCIGATDESFKAFKSVGVLVFVNAPKDWQGLPLAAKHLSRRPEAGRIIPQVFVTTADGGRGLEVVSYERLKADARKAAREVKKLLEDEDVVGEAGAGEDEPAAEEAAIEQAPLEEWTDLQGRTMKAAALKVSGAKVSFRLEDGRVVDYPIASLSGDDRKRLEALRR